MTQIDFWVGMQLQQSTIALHDYHIHVAIQTTQMINTFAILFLP